MHNVKEAPGEVQFEIKLIYTPTFIHTTDEFVTETLLTCLVFQGSTLFLKKP